MTPELLAHYKALQPVFEAMGPIQGEDRCWYLDNGDRIVLPMSIDDRNPERGLWGMVDWQRFDYVKCSKTGDMKIYLKTKKIPCWLLICEDTPTLALLKALAAQHEVEVKP